MLPGSAGPLSTGLLSSNSSRPGTGFTEVAFGGCGCPQSVEFQGGNQVYKDECMYLGGGFTYFWNFHPYLGKMNPF